RKVAPVARKLQRQDRLVAASTRLEDRLDRATVRRRARFVMRDGQGQTAPAGVRPVLIAIVDILTMFVEVCAERLLRRCRRGHAESNENGRTFPHLSLPHCHYPLPLWISSLRCGANWPDTFH